MGEQTFMKQVGNLAMLVVTIAALGFCPMDARADIAGASDHPLSVPLPRF